MTNLQEKQFFLLNYLSTAKAIIDNKNSFYCACATCGRLKSSLREKSQLILVSFF